MFISLKIKAYMKQNIFFMVVLKSLKSRFNTIHSFTTRSEEVKMAKQFKSSFK
jgi:hypothetical protein